MAAEGAEIIDIGAESTRPYNGMRPVTADDEIARLKPVLPAVAGLGIPVSIDTMKARVAVWALEAGATIVNDVWGLQRDPDRAKIVAGRGAPVIVMHNRDSADAGIDIMQDIAAFFERSLDIAIRAGIPENHIVLDPGIGFGKTAAHSLTLLRHLPRIVALGFPVLVGASRKSSIARIAGDGSSEDQRLGGSIAAGWAAARAGAAMMTASK